jgi:hypothetical protein
MKNLVQCAVPTRSNHQIHFACFRHKSPRIPAFPRQSHLDAMSGCSLPSNRSAESVILGDFPVENQMNPFAPSFGFHGDTQLSKKCSPL